MTDLLKPLDRPWPMGTLRRPEVREPANSVRFELRQGEVLPYRCFSMMS